MDYKNDLVNLVLLKSKRNISDKELRKVEDIELSYPEWNKEFEAIRVYLCSRGYIDRIDVNPDLPLQDEYGGGIVYKDGEKFEYQTNKKGVAALREKVFPSDIERRREDEKDRRITRIIAVSSGIIAVISILMQIATWLWR